MLLEEKGEETERNKIRNNLKNRIKRMAGIDKHAPSCGSQITTQEQAKAFIICKPRNAMEQIQ